MLVRAALACAVVAFAAVPAHAEDRPASGQFALALDGAEGGLVRFASASERSRKVLTLSTEQPTAPVLGVVRAFLDGKAPNKSLVLSTPAMLQKVKDAKLVGVRLPSYAGGATDLALTFEAASVSTSPSLRAASDRVRPSGVKLASFRLSLGDLPTNEARRLDAVAFRNKEGAAIPGAFAFDVPTRDAPRFLAWSKKPAARSGSIEYVSSLGEAMLSVKIAGCTPSSVERDGPATHVVVTCARARSS